MSFYGDLDELDGLFNPALACSLNPVGSELAADAAGRAAMVRFEMILRASEAERFDRFFWGFVEDKLPGDEAHISLTAFTGLGEERRIITVETGEQADAFRAAWAQSLLEEEVLEAPAPSPAKSLKALRADIVTTASGGL